VRGHAGAVAVAVAASLAGCGATVTATAMHHRESAASCVATHLTLSAHAAPAGATVSAHGKWFAADCYDTGQPGSPPPLTGLHLSVAQGGRTWQVASNVSASNGGRYTFHVPVVLPSDLRPGTAIVRVDEVGTTANLRVQRDR
jgi:hypothetical protein